MFSVRIAIPIGIAQAVRRNTALDYTATFLGFVFYSTPIFFLSLMLVLWFSINLGWFPAQAPQATTVAGILADPAGLVLPVASLVLLDVALFTRYMRSATMDNLVQDYVRTAFAKGAGSRVLYRHVLRNSLIPMVTILGLSLPILIAGSLVTEQVFNYPGMGLLFYQEAVTNDYPVLLGITLSSASPPSSATCWPTSGTPSRPAGEGARDVSSPAPDDRPEALGEAGFRRPHRARGPAPAARSTDRRTSLLRRGSRCSPRTGSR